MSDLNIKGVVNKELNKLKEEPVETLTIMIPRSLKKQLKVKAINSDSTVTEILLDCIVKHVAK